MSENIANFIYNNESGLRENRKALAKYRKYIYTIMIEDASYFFITNESRRMV
ncbi:hypothetical protein LALCM10_170201 [Dellaglioa algida]|nr:hypothetical protein LALCM10_170201 [Dellaglioa algida]